MLLPFHKTSCFTLIDMAQLKCRGHDFEIFCNLLWDGCFKKSEHYNWELQVLGEKK